MLPPRLFILGFCMSPCSPDYIFTLPGWEWGALRSWAFTAIAISGRRLHDLVVEPSAGFPVGLAADCLSEMFQQFTGFLLGNLRCQAAH